MANTSVSTLSALRWGRAPTMCRLWTLAVNPLEYVSGDFDWQDHTLWLKQACNSLHRQACL